MLELSLEYPLLDNVERFGTITPAQTVGTKLVGEQGISQMPYKWIYLIEGNIIKADGQLFRIYHKSKTPTSIKCNCRHIFYDLADNFLEDVRPTNKTGLASLQYILANTQYPHTFVATGDVAGLNTKYFVRTNLLDAIMGTDSILSMYDGELYRDNFNIGYWQNRGNDDGYLIMGGKNIIGIEETLNMDNVATRIMPIGANGLLLPEKYINSPYIYNYPHPKVKTVDFNDVATVTELRTATNKYILDSKCDLPLVNFNVDFVELSKTEEYKNYGILQSVDVGDIVTIRYEKINLNLKAKVIRTTKNIITGNLDKVELGNFKGNIATTLNNIANVITPGGQIKGSKIQGIIDATKASFQAMSDSAETQNEKAILFEDNDITSPTYGSMCLGTKGFEIASIKTNNEWQYTTFGTGQGFIADLIVAGKILGNNAEFNLDEGFLKVTHSDGSYTKIDASGTQRFVGTTGKSYHYLSYSGSLNITGTQTGFETRIINIPAEFIGTAWYVVGTMAGFGSSGYDLGALRCSAAKINATQIQLEAYVNTNVIGSWDLTMAYFINA